MGNAISAIRFSVYTVEGGKKILEKSDYIAMNNELDKMRKKVIT